MKYVMIILLFTLQGCATLTTEERLGWMQLGNALQQVGNNIQMNNMQNQIYRNQCLACR